MISPFTRRDQDQNSFYFVAPASSSDFVSCIILETRVVLILIDFHPTDLCIDPNRTPSSATRVRHPIPLIPQEQQNKKQVLQCGAPFLVAMPHALPPVEPPPPLAEPADCEDQADASHNSTTSSCLHALLNPGNVLLLGIVRVLARFAERRAQEAENRAEQDEGHANQAERERASDTNTAERRATEAEDSQAIAPAQRVFDTPDLRAHILKLRHCMMMPDISQPDSELLWISQSYRTSRWWTATPPALPGWPLKPRGAERPSSHGSHQQEQLAEDADQLFIAEVLADPLVLEALAVMPLAQPATSTLTRSRIHIHEPASPHPPVALMAAIRLTPD